MRPEEIENLEHKLENLPWAGPILSKKLERLGIRTVFDLLKHLPSGFLQRRFVRDVREATPGEVIVLPVCIMDYQLPSFRRGAATRKRQPWIIEAQNGREPVRLVFFNIPPLGYTQKTFKPGSMVHVTGKLEFFHGFPSLVHPVVFYPDDRHHPDGFEPVYPLTQGITQSTMYRLVTRALDCCPELPEWISEDTRRLLKASSWKQSLLRLHQPGRGQPVDLVRDPGRLRLGFDELLANQLGFLSIRRACMSRKGKILQGKGELQKALLDVLPFRLTNDQEIVINEISRDLAADVPMMRLLQGDVGTGKTVVAMMAMLRAIEAGSQGALMAPTEILARQHGKTLLQWAEKLGIRGAVLTGRDKGKARRLIQEEIASGKISFVAGTHALIQENVLFKDLGVVIIDEQHRFGVNQRLALVEKGQGVNVLSMTATPIPRTLVLTAWGDLDCSYLREKPAMRKEISTFLYSLERLDEIISSLKRALEQGHLIYWVCPLVEESSAIDLAASEERFACLDKDFPGKVGLVHGRMKDAEKTDVMERFKNGSLRILVATTVIEVGVDVPDATVMIIEHAERFGLAQLHQLRGRVGRGEKPGICMLLYHPGLSSASRQRLEVMRKTTDGFILAEEDLKLRGSGDPGGLRQSGVPPLVFADLATDQDILKLARKEAEDFLRQDPFFTSPRGHAMKILLHLFGKDESLRFLSAV